MNGIIIKKQANQFLASSEGNVFLCISRGKHKVSGLYVGDMVTLTKEGDNIIIEQLLKRKNLLVRPPVANIDQMLIVIAPLPKPDFILVDKLLLLCALNAITPVLCVNKSDLFEQGFLLDVQRQYQGVVNIVSFSAKTQNNLPKLKELLKGKVSAFAGQSAVGKSHITNALLGEQITQVGELSKKIERGKNTTRHTELFEVEPNTFLVDTAGFSLLDEELMLLDPSELWRYYPEMVSLAHRCKFLGCTHTKEGDDICAVASAAKQGIIAPERLQRYRVLFETMKDKWRNRHGK